jgi:hypothetical protein
MDPRIKSEDDGGEIEASRLDADSQRSVAAVGHATHLSIKFARHFSSLRYAACRQGALHGAAREGNAVMQFRDMPAQPGKWKVVLIGVAAAVIAAFAIVDNDRMSAALAGAALLGVGLLLVLPVRHPAN